MSELDRIMTSLVAVDTFIFGEHVAKLNMNTPITILHVILSVKNSCVGQDLPADTLRSCAKIYCESGSLPIGSMTFILKAPRNQSWNTLLGYWLPSVPAYTPNNASLA